MKSFSLFIPWLIVCIATVGSLFFGEILKLPPCTLCWYQRMSLFPLTIILGIAAFRGAYRIILYVLPLSLIGLSFSIYHTVAIQFFAENSLCPTCVLKAIPEAPLLFPLLSLATFTLLSVSLIWIYLHHKKSKKL